MRGVLGIDRGKCSVAGGGRLLKEEESLSNQETE